MTPADNVSTPSESELSDIRDAPADTDSEDVEMTDAPPLEDEDEDGEQSNSSSDQDAEGSEDADYVMDGEQPQSHQPFSRSASEASSRTRKRKTAGTDEQEYIRSHPDLFNLRRSGRARTNRRIVETSSDESTDEAPRNRKRRKTASSTPKASQRPTPSAATEDSDGSDEYVSNRRNATTKKQRRRQLQVAAGLAPPSRTEVRFSTRNAAKVTNYNEDDEDDLDDDEDEAAAGYTYAAENNTPSVDVVLDHRRKDGVATDVYNGDKDDYEFQIKWTDQAHYHATWETFATLQGYRGYRRVENYFRKTVLVEQHILYDDEASPEDREAWAIQRDQDMRKLEVNKQVERVIGDRDGEQEKEYYVKWRSLPYIQCTWESETLVSKLAQEQIDRYLDRSARVTESNKKESNLATRSEYKRFDHPTYINGELREFQITGINFLAHNWCKGHNVILADEMGLGKTVQTVSFLSWLRHARGQEGPFIIVVPLSTLPAWAETFDDWTPDMNVVVYNGNEASRTIIREHELLIDGNVKKVKFNVMLTTYEYILADCAFLSQIKWQFLAVDEAHRLKNRDSQLYLKLKDFNSQSRLLITGTPMQNTLGELSALMDFLMPGRIQVDDDIDLGSEEASRKLAELTAAISPYMIRRTKQKVEKDLPPKSEKIIRVELSDIQLEYYKNILTRNYAALNQGAKGPKQSLLNIMMELKKASNHPFMFPNAEERLLAGGDRKEDRLKALITSSGKMMLLDQLLTKLKKDNHRVLIFCQMVKMLDILGEYLRLRGYQFQRLDGTIPSTTRDQSIQHFNDPESNDFCFILSTRAGGLGINLMTADTVILFDSDWNPQMDLQAMARAHRIGQHKPVTIYRFLSKDTVEEEVLERARNKLMLEFITIHRGVTDRDAKELPNRFARSGHSVYEPTSSDDISRILKRRGQKMFEQSGNQKKLEELDIDAVLENAEEHKTEQLEGITADGGEEFLKSFEYTDVKIDLEWDQIIPKEQLDAIKAEEDKQKQEEYLQTVIQQNAPRKRKQPDSGVGEREQREAKRRARKASKQAAATASEDESEPEFDPLRPLDEKETRNLIRSYERYGSLEERGDEMIRDAKLVGRNKDVLSSTLNEVITISKNMIDAEKARVEAIERDTNKALTKKDRKAVLFDFRGVKRVNAETIMERPIEMKMLKDIIATSSDWRYFRIPEARKPTEYTCEWGAREDGMLCVGINRHGYGAWVAIRDDPELGLTEKLFLEEHRVDNKKDREKDESKKAKSPGAVHLVRRANYLLSVLKDKTSDGTNIAAKRATENHHRNSKKWKNSADKSASVSASPAPAASVARKPHREGGLGEPKRHRSTSQTEHLKHGEHKHGEHRHRRRESLSHHHDAAAAHNRRASDHHRRSDGHDVGHHNADSHHPRPGNHHRHQSSEHRRRQSSVDHEKRNGAPAATKRKADDSEEKLTFKRRKSDEHEAGAAANMRRTPSHQRNGGAANGNGPAKGNGPGKKEDEIAVFFKPVVENLAELRSCTPQEMPEKEGRVALLKRSLRKIGRHIEAEVAALPKAAQTELESALWRHVTRDYWPAKKADVAAVKTMFDKIKGSGTAATAPNGEKKASA
ncbi:P-loop containing nucleoside triphosphate hydrolase protein [Lineolata rhizophorae]|uniref:P-loop containing nucleoside triphosphate hydrolase protein n=1 Tax=Lineolata rhizophorae TaxID=578093 RepID=A0A6A6PAP5_9PEZI|nr:P-loop containing nucleoside triphosphate hydrolase protein [Lineolata rhizophorae]